MKNKRIFLSMLIASATLASTPWFPAHRSSLPKNIQTDQAINYGGELQANLRYVERVPAMTGESKALVENLKLIAATL